MGKSIYLINPAAEMPTYFGAEIHKYLGFASTASIADLATTTVAALIPNDFSVVVCDEHITPANPYQNADFIGITGKSNQVSRMIELAKQYRQQGRIVIIGGPFASLSPEVVRPYCDILVRGEIENVAHQLFSDLRRGDWQADYVGDQPDLSQSPIPRWDLYPNERALAGAVQTSRGCPFECEFCDVIQYVGRKQRHKPVKQVLEELDTLYKLGYRRVFLADDNLTVYRRRAVELLTALRSWNDQHSPDRMTFSTQLSIDTARETEILHLAQTAGLFEVFIGIETPNEASLRETKKRQNLGLNVVEQVQRFLDYGISVMGGMIVGFDSDGPDIFEKQYEFAMATPIPIFSLGALVAPATTPLHQRLKLENRLVSDDLVGVEGSPFHTNIVPRQMNQESLLTGLKWLGNRLYQPEAFGERVLKFIRSFTSQETQFEPIFKRLTRQVDLEVAQVVQNIRNLGPDEAQMLSKVIIAAANKPSTRHHVMSMLFFYMQARYMYQQGQFWEPHLLEAAKPPTIPLEFNATARNNDPGAV